MRHLLTKAFAPTSDSDQETRRHILWWLVIRVLVFALLIGIALFFQLKGQNVILPPAPVTGICLAAFALFSLAAAGLVHNKRWPARRVGLVQLFCDTVCTALLVFATGGAQSNFTPVLILPVIAGGLILYRLGGLFLAATATIAYGAILASEFAGWIPRYFFAASYKPPANLLAATNLFAIYGLIFFLAALLSGQLARRLRVTEEKLSRTALEFDRLSLLYKQIFDDISTGIITTDQGDFITSYNQAAERITGLVQENVLGQPFNRCFPTIVLQQRQGRNVCDFHKADGTAIRIGYSFSQLNMPVEEEDSQTRARWKVITLQDISQIERMEQQVREAEKMAAIGELSASIAHDFRNPLAAISGSAQILSMEQEHIAALDPATFKTLLSIILRESARMAKTITDFLQFARPAAIQPEWFDLNRLLDKVIAQVQGATNATTRISKEITDHLDCWADRQQLQTVLTHLLENACSAVSGDSGMVVVAAEEIVADASGGGLLCVEVRDQGPGIAPELREKVFAPFFSNRADGTGLGLAIVRQIVDNHGGSIEIDSNASYGCIMRIRLPLPQSATL